jgi:hypothetical protein
MQTLDNLGDELEFVIVRGATFGPHEVEVTDADGAVVDLANAEIVVVMIPTDGSAAVPWEVDVTLPNLIAFEFPEAASTAFPTPTGYWRFTIRWGDGRVEEYAYGPVKFVTRSAG